MTEPDESDSSDAIWPILADSYADIENAWRELLDSGVVDPHSKHGHGGPDTAEHLVLVFADLTGVMAASAIGGHLNLLSRGYWPPRTELDLTPVEQMAIYPPARAVLEAAAIICWAQDGDLDEHDRLLRAAELWLWSATGSSTNDPAEAATAITAAGLTLDRPRRGKLALVVEGKRRPVLTISRMVRSMFGGFGMSMYGVWSSASHSDPLHIRNALQEVSHGEGYVNVSFKIDPFYHLLTAGVVANTVGLAVHSYGQSTGRDSERVQESCDRLVLQTFRLFPLIDADLAAVIDEATAEGFGADDEG